MTRSTSTTDAPVWVAIDVAKSTHDVHIEFPNGQRRAFRMGSHRADVERLTALLQATGRPCRVAFEPTGDYHRPLAYWLAEAGCEVCQVSSVAVARTRDALYNSWDKHDAKDAQVILHLLKAGTTQRYVDPARTGYLDLQEFAGVYQQVSLRKVRVWHSVVTHYLPLYFPEAERFHSSTRAAWFTRVLQWTPCPAAVLTYSREAFIDGGRRLGTRPRNQARWLADFYTAAQESVGVPVAPDSEAMRQFRGVLSDYLLLCERRAAVEREVETRLGDHPDFRRLRTVPGIGPILALTILAEARDLRRFRHARQFLKYCGFDLCTEQSGRFRGTTHLSKRGNARLRFACWMAATVAVRMGENSCRRKYEDYMRADPLSGDRRRKAYTAVAAKMARVIHALVTTGHDYRRFPEATRPGGRIPSRRAVEALATS
jgi:transposase